MWSLILDEKKPLFTTEKFLSQASEEGGTHTHSHMYTHTHTRTLHSSLSSLSSPMFSTAAMREALPGSFPTAHQLQDTVSVCLCVRMQRVHVCLCVRTCRLCSFLPLCCGPVSTLLF